MMGRALLVIGSLAWAGFAVNGVLGYFIAGQTSRLSTHILLGLVSALLLLFSHSWILFYFIGTGRAVKETVAEHGLEAALIEETRRFKRATSPWLMLAILLAIATFVVGGGVVSGSVPRRLHGALFLVTLVVQGWALWVEARALAANDRLMAGLNRRLAGS